MGQIRTTPTAADKELATLRQTVEAQSKQIEVMTKSFNDFREKMATTRKEGHPDPNNPDQWGGYIRKGEDPFTSRGLSMMKMLGICAGYIKPEMAKVEMDVSSRLSQCYGNGRPGSDSCYERVGINRNGLPSMLCPVSTKMLHDEFVPASFRHEMKELVVAGVGGADPDEMSHIRRKQLIQRGYSTKALSWLGELTGGSLVAPPEMGELIELLRNKEALVNAGARVVPLPPQGRLKYPRQTAPSNTFWVGENAPITESLIGTGEVTLQAKKLAVLIKAPNELIRFASPAAEALLRDDMTKSLALGLDLAGLEGTGGDHRPRGVINNPNITIIKSSDQRLNGDAFRGEDIYRMIAAVEEGNAEFECFLMRPKSLYKWYQLRSDAVSQGDKAGPFLFNLIREAGDNTPAKLAGYDVVTSTQVSQVRAKGNSTALTYILGGMFSDLLIGMFGAIEFAATTMGDTAFVNDQSWLRGILTCDVAVRHEVGFVLLDNLDPTI